MPHISSDHNHVITVCIINTTTTSKQLMGLPRRPPPTKAPATPTHGASLAVPDETNLDAFVPVEALDGALTLEVAVAAVDPTQPETGPSLARARFDAPLDDVQHAHEPAEDENSANEKGNNTARDRNVKTNHGNVRNIKTYCKYNTTRCSRRKKSFTPLFLF